MKFKKYTILFIILTIIILIPGSFVAQEETEEGASTEEAKTEEGAGVEEKKEEESPQDKELRRALKVIEERSKELDEREKRLDEKDQKLILLKQEIETKLENLKALDAKVKQALFNLQKENEAAEQRIIDANEKKFKDLAKVYENMKAKKAAIIINSMDIEVAKKMFPYMRPQTAGEVLANVNPVKAAAISKALTAKEVLMKK